MDREMSIKEPTNEAETVMLFSKICEDMGYEIVSIQSPFPDAVIKNKKGEEFSVEFEYRSSNFVSHKHDPNGCNVIICWINDLGEFPVQIISLKEYLEDKEIEKEKEILKHINIYGFISSFSWFLIGFTIVLTFDDPVIKFLVATNMALFAFYLLGSFWLEKREQ